MRAIVVHSVGAPDVLRTGHRPVPEPGPGEVLVRLHAVGVNFSDTERRRGVYDPPALPWIPGNEAAGVVEALGRGRPDWLGRRVAFWAPRTSGTYAEYARRARGTLFTLLDDVDFAVAAALPAQGLTAYGLAYVATALAPGQTALVHAAAGGVGALLVQLLVAARGPGVRHRVVRRQAGARSRPLGATPVSYGAELAGRFARPPAAGAWTRCSIRSGRDHPGGEPGGAGPVRAAGLLRRGERLARRRCSPTRSIPATSG